MVARVSSFVVLLLAAAPAFAQLPAARVTSVFPPGGKAGSTVEVTVTGIDLDGATELRFSQPGVTAKSAGSASATEVKFTLTLAPDAAVGIHDCRVVGKFGISNPRGFVVGDRDEAADLKPTSSIEKATALKLDTVASARTTAGGFDHWLVEATQGQRVVVECATREIDSKLWPTLAVLDSSGREVAQSRRSGIADFTAPADGAYVIRVSDLQYRGGPEFAYRLTASTGPRLDAIYPAAAKPGTAAKYTLLGRNLPGGKPSAMKTADGRPLDELTVDIELPKSLKPADQLASAGLVGPSGVALDGFAYRLKSDRGISNPIGIVFTESDVTLEAESAQPGTTRNDVPADAQRLTLPATVSGRFHARGDRDVYVL